jgi:hypothetical protein
MNESIRQDPMLFNAVEFAEHELSMLREGRSRSNVEGLFGQLAECAAPELTADQQEPGWTFEQLQLFPEVPQEVSRLRRIGSAVVGLAGSFKDKSVFAYHLLREDPKEFARRSAYYIKNTTEAAVVGAELTPLNEMARYAVLGWAHAATGGNSPVAAVAFGAATFVIEGAAAVFAADLLERETSKKVIGHINKAAKKYLNDDQSQKEMHIVTRAATAMVLGSAVLTAAKHRKNPERTKEQNQVEGIRTAAIMGTYFTAEGYLTSEAAQSMGWPRTIGALVLLTIGVGHAYNALGERFREKKNQTSTKNK